MTLAPARLFAIPARGRSRCDFRLSGTCHNHQLCAELELVQQCNILDFYPDKVLIVVIAIRFFVDAFFWKNPHL